MAEAREPTRHGEFRCIAWRVVRDGTEHLAFMRGDVRGSKPVLAQVTASA